VAKDGEDGAGVAMNNRGGAPHAQVVVDQRNPGRAFLQAEIDANRRFEWLLPLKALLALVVVLVFVVIRRLYFE
jgi:hypothetical protein